MKLIIAEKPAMGRDIAQALSELFNQPIKADSARMCQWVGEYAIIGAQGHMFRLVDAEYYGQEFAFPWRLETLPVLPEQFVLEPNYEKVNGEVVNNDLTKSKKKRLASIKGLLEEADAVCHAGDPDREGQSIVDDLLREFGFKGPVKRLWLHAQTNEEIKKAFISMKSNQEYKTLGLAAVARRESDWAIGINATRAYSTLWWKRGHKGSLQIGRVVTPLVGMVVQREKDIEAFVPIEHYSLIATVQFDDPYPFVGEWQLGVHEGDARFDSSGKLLLDRVQAEKVRHDCTGKQGRVMLAKKTPSSEAPPLLFSLIELQKAAAKMGYSPDEVLLAAQALYEKHKLTSYPRTECQYAPVSELAKASKVIESIKNNFSGQFNVPGEIDLKNHSAAWNDKKLGDHFAIIPIASSCKVGNLNRCELDVYRLVCRQYLAQFLEPYKYLQSVIEVVIESHKFRSTGRTPVSLGWRALFGASLTKIDSAVNKIDPIVLPNVKEHDVGDVVKVDLKCGKTDSPKRFTAITLLEAMEKAYLFVTDPGVRAKLKDVEGIGTAATRSGIIKKAITSFLIGEDKSNKVISYYPTPKSFGYIASLPNVLTKPDLTAWFEGKLQALKNGSLEYDRYRTVLSKLVRHILVSANDGSAYAGMPTPSELPDAIKPRKQDSRKPNTANRAKRKKVAS